MNKAGNNEKFDVDIVQCKADILRNRNIKPQHNNTAHKNSEKKKNDNPAEISIPRNVDSIPIETIPAQTTAPLSKPAMITNEKREARIPKETPDLPQCDAATARIPTFNLAEEIMAEQRKITAIKRKAPGSKIQAQRLKPETRIDDHSIEKPKQLLSEQEKIIAEIVARDIEELSRGHYSST